MDHITKHHFLITQAFLTVSFIFLLPVLDFLWPFVSVFNSWHRFLVSFPLRIYLFPFRNTFEIPVDLQRISRARTLAPCRATWMGMSSNSHFDFSCICFLDRPLSTLDLSKRQDLSCKSFTPSAFSQAKAGLWDTMFVLHLEYPGEDF